jgi:hypothetical protein
MEIQRRLFEHIKARHPNIVLKDAIMEILGTGRDATYDRLNCKTRLSLIEFKTICESFNLSSDDILFRNSQKNIMFSYQPVWDEKSYIDHLLQQSDTLYSMRLATDREMLLTAEDIPFYHFLKYPELAIFRIFAWNNTQYGYDKSFPEFYSSSDNNPIISLYEKIYDNCMHIPSKEIWTPQTTGTTLRMLQYYYDSGYTDRNATLRLAGQLTDMLDTLQQHATTGCRQNEAKTPFALYHCRVDVENDFAMLRHNGEWLCYTKLFAINGIVTHNRVMRADTQQWIENLMLKSIPISGNVALRERFQFFSTLKGAVQDFVGTVKY